jgi:hypothetical protein
VLEELGKKLGGDKVNIGFIDGKASNGELLKESYGVTGFPHMYLLRDGHSHFYSGDRSLPSFEEFVTREPADQYVKTAIPARIGKLGLYLKYAQRDAPKIINKIIKQADEHVFIPANLSHLEHNTKIVAISSTVIGVIVTFITACFLCCKPRKPNAHDTSKGKPSSRTRREKID